MFTWTKGGLNVIHLYFIKKFEKYNINGKINKNYLREASTSETNIQWSKV